MKPFETGPAFQAELQGVTPANRMSGHYVTVVGVCLDPESERFIAMATNYG